MTKRSAVRGELIAYASFGKRMTTCMRSVLRRRPSERMQNEAVRITKVGDQDKGLHAGDIR